MFPFADIEIVSGVDDIVAGVRADPARHSLKCEHGHGVRDSAVQCSEMPTNSTGYDSGGNVGDPGRNVRDRAYIREADNPNIWEGRQRQWQRQRKDVEQGDMSDAYARDIAPFYDMSDASTPVKGGDIRTNTPVKGGDIRTNTSAKLRAAKLKVPLTLSFTPSTTLLPCPLLVYPIYYSFTPSATRLPHLLLVYLVYPCPVLVLSLSCPCSPLFSLVC